jgi:co-chaperonin GroES (HSP10)
MPFMLMSHDKEPKKTLKKEIGSVDTIEIFNNQVLVVVYVRPEKTKSGIILTSNTRDEDRIQGKVGLVLKKGPQAFVDPSNTWFGDVDIEIDDWVFYRPSDGWSVTINGVLCRVLDDTNIRGRIQNPDHVW